MRLLSVLNDTPMYWTLPIWFPVAYVLGMYLAAMIGAPIGSSAQ